MVVTTPVGGKQSCHHQPGSQSCQAAGAIIFIGHADTNTDNEQDRNVIDQSSACFYQEESQCLSKANYVTTLHGGRTK